MSWPSHVWDQLKGIKADELIRALEKDGWRYIRTTGSAHIYRHMSGRGVSIHYHPRKTFGAKLLQKILRETRWTESDLRRLKLIK